MNRFKSSFSQELLPRLELGTASLPRKCSTTELLQHSVRAENGAQTRDPQLGRLVLYQLSYFRVTSLKEVGGDGFEPPKSKDNRFTVCPIWPLWKPPFFFFLSREPLVGFEPTTPRLQITCSGQLS